MLSDLIHQLVFGSVMRVPELDGLLAENHAIPANPAADSNFKPHCLRSVVAVDGSEEEAMASRVTIRLDGSVGARNPDSAIKLRRGEISEEAASAGRRYHVEDCHPGTAMGTKQAFESFMTEIDHVFVADQAIPVSDNCEWVADALRIDGHDRAIPLRPPGSVADVHVGEGDWKASIVERGLPAPGLGSRHR